MQSRNVAGRVICGAPCILGSAPRVLSSQCRSCAAGSSYIWLLGLCRQACHSEHTKGFRTLVFSDLLFFILYLTAVSFRCSQFDNMRDTFKSRVCSGPGIQCRILCVSIYSYIVCWVSGPHSHTHTPMPLFGKHFYGLSLPCK